MQFVCQAYTAGGPVAIMPLVDAQQWSGGWGDYFQVIERHEEGWLQHFELNNRCSGCLFHQEVDGNYHVYYEKDAILILSERYAPDEEHSLSQALPDYETDIIPGTVLEIPKFGGLIAVFDSAYPGNLITLTNTGYQTIDFPSDSDNSIGLPQKANAVVLDVNRGVWQAVEIHREDDAYSFDGVLFRWIG